MAQEEVSKDKDPGAARHGNFINYYQFNSPENRIKLLPTDIWHAKENENFVCLDIGCNTGELTGVLYEFLLKYTRSVKESSVCEERNCNVMGIDLDPVLIQRANELNKHPQHIEYRHLDFLSQESKEAFFQYLHTYKKTRFDVIFCFSVTMWIHLNHGDEGLLQFLHNVAKLTEFIVIEPQPWKCYRNASRRMRRLSEEEFTEFSNLKIRSNVESEINRIIVDECNFVSVRVTPETPWGRRIHCYRLRSS